MEIKGFMTVAKASQPNQGGRSEKFIYTALKLGKIKGVRVSRFWLIPDDEVLKLRNGEIKLSREDMGIR